MDRVDMIITISQSLPDNYNIDVFATATRGGENENMNYTRESNSKSVDNASSETIVTTLPDTFMKNGSQAIFYGKYFETKVDEHLFYEEKNVAKQKNSDINNYPNTKIYSGPGGNYLSNEIFYRVALLREKFRQEGHIPPKTGHFHISKLQDEKVNEDISEKNNQDMLDIVITSIKEGVKGI